MSIHSYTTLSPLTTRGLGRGLAQKILQEGQRATPPLRPTKKDAFVIALSGDLGGGKTTFLQGFARGLGVEEKILSPTFVIMKKFSLQTPRFKHLYHFDCYRVEKPKEILELGFGEIVHNPKNIVVVEWADRLKSILPQQTLWLRFNFKNKNKREIIIQNYGS